MATFTSIRNEIPHLPDTWINRTMARFYKLVTDPNTINVAMSFGIGVFVGYSISRGIEVASYILKE